MNNLEFIIYKTTMAFNNMDTNPNHEQISQAIQKQFPQMHYPATTISRTTRRMVEHTELIKTGEGYRVPIVVKTTLPKKLEEQRFLKQFV